MSVEKFQVRVPGNCSQSKLVLQLPTVHPVSPALICYMAPLLSHSTSMASLCAVCSLHCCNREQFFTCLERKGCHQNSWFQHTHTHTHTHAHTHTRFIQNAYPVELHYSEKTKRWYIMSTELYSKLSILLDG